MENLFVGEWYTVPYWNRGSLPAHAGTQEYGRTTIIDLRSENERHKLPRNCMMMNLISYISLFIRNMEEILQGIVEDKKWHYLSFFGRTNESGN